MRTYIYHRITCSRETAEKLFIEHVPRTAGCPAYRKVTLDRFMGNPEIKREIIFSGYGSLVSTECNRADLRFCTLDTVPSDIIYSAVRNAPDIKWHVCRDSIEKIYRYSSDGENTWEDILEIDQEDLSEWIMKETDYGTEELEIEECDCEAWHITAGKESGWLREPWKAEGKESRRNA